MSVLLRLAVKKYLTHILLFLILAIGFALRFVNFEESVYFGFDEARDAYVSQSIINDKDIIIVGPPASGNIGIHHGSLYWYLIAPLYYLSGGNFWIVAAIFRVINLLGVLLVFYFGKVLFGSNAGILAAFLYATSFEQSQYAMYVGNPAWSVLTITATFLGLCLIYFNKNIKLGLIMMFVFTALSIQFNILYSYLIFIDILVLLISRDKFSKINMKTWMLGIAAFAAILSTYILAEIKFGFNNIRSVMRLTIEGVNLVDPNKSKMLIYFEKLRTVFEDNLLPFNLSPQLISVFVVGFFILLFIMARRDRKYLLGILFLIGSVIVNFFGSHNAYYLNSGVGVVLVILFSGLVFASRGVFKWALVGLCVLMGSISAVKIIDQSKNSLIVEMKPQPMMKLNDELMVIDRLYEKSQGKGFTIRLTGIPYKIPTVWSFLMDNYADKKWNNRPFFEYGHVEGFPGKLTQPSNGTTCLRFIVVEPRRGLSDYVINHDVNVENDLSTKVDTETIGEFTIETRRARDKNCHNNWAI